MKAKRETASFWVTTALLAGMSLVTCSSPPTTPPEVQSSKPIATAVDHHKAPSIEEPLDAANLLAPETPIEIRAETIRREIAALRERNTLPAGHWSHEWAGEYYVGDGLGVIVTLTVAPASGITYTWYGCMGLYDSNYASAVDAFDDDGDGKPEGLKVQWQMASAERYGYNSERLYFVRWDGPKGGVGRQYLIPESEMMDVVNEYNEGSYARDALYSAPRKRHRADDRRSWIAQNNEPVIGTPKLPERWAGLLLTAPIVAKVTSVTAPTTRVVTQGVDVVRARVTLDKGSESGVFLGMTFRVGDGDAVGTLTIDRVTRQAAEGEVVYYTQTGVHGVVAKVGATLRIPDFHSP
jgi:hypothetical protein